MLEKDLKFYHNFIRNDEIILSFLGWYFYLAAPSSYLAMLDKLRKRICRTVGPSFSLLSLLKLWFHCQNAARLGLFYRHYFGRCSSEVAQLVPLPYSRGMSTRLTVTPRCYKDVFVKSFLRHTAKLSNSLSI